ncbi:MAG: basic amino acid ABC transporter substrate-binding protein [Lachnospiraceae bacterium]|nr:basic amino acid ABC transporter substrate-binding protein [Lachnospiraceae bacterium]
MKKATKTAALMLVLAMMTTALTACGNSADTSGSTAVDTTVSTAQTQESTAADAGQAEAGTQEAAPEAGGTLTFGTNAEFPPFEFVTSNGVIDQYDGIDMAIAKQIAEKNGMTAAIENMEFDSLLVALQNGQIDAAIAGMTVTEERKEEADFSIPYYTATQVMIVREDSDITSAADLADKKICVIQGYTGEICVKDMGYPYEAFKKGTDAIMELVNGKCDVVVLDSATSQKYVNDNEGLKIVEDPSAFESEEYAIAVKKGNTELLDKINTAIDAMLTDGTVAELGAQYTEELSAE